MSDRIQILRVASELEDVVGDLREVAQVPTEPALRAAFGEAASSMQRLAHEAGLTMTKGKGPFDWTITT